MSKDVSSRLTSTRGPVSDAPVLLSLMRILLTMYTCNISMLFV